MAGHWHRQLAFPKRRQIGKKVNIDHLENTMTPTIADRRAAFRALHLQGCFVVPNPWDAGSARLLEGLGFKALATTSSGHAWSLGRPDGAISRALTLEHMRAMVDVTALPLNADFEGGFGADPDGVAESVRMAVATGVAGLSIEDSTGDADHPLRDLDDAVARLRAARSAIDDTGGDTLLVGRAENFIAGRPDIDDTLRRLKAYAEAGADCLYAPGIRRREHIAAVVAAVTPKPVNLLIGSASEFSVADVAALGVRRISVGGALARAAWGAFLRAAQTIAGEGRFDGLADGPSNQQMNATFGSVTGSNSDR
jgi:2-methylisocitrate lyase-like PEP mutase family enzyme